MKRILTIFALIAALALPLRASSQALPSVTSAVTVGQSVTLPNVPAYSTCAVTVSGTWSGSLVPTSSTGASLLVRSYASDTATSASITANGKYYVVCAGVDSLVVTAQSGFTGSATITLLASPGIAKLGILGVGSVAATAPITSSGGSSPTIGCATCVVLNPASAQTGNLNISGSLNASGSVGASGTVGSSTYLFDAGGSGITLPSNPQVAISYNRSSTQGEMDLWSQYNDTGAPDAKAAFSFWGYNNGAPTNYVNIERNGAIVTGSSSITPTSATVNGPITQPGYAQHGILSITTPASCTAFSACAGGSVSFTTAMTVATYECTATAETYPYTVVVSAKTTTAATFEIYPLVAVSSAQTVPVDYACAV